MSERKDIAFPEPYLSTALAAISNLALSPVAAADAIAEACAQAVSHAPPNTPPPEGEEGDTPGLESFLWSFWTKVVGDVVQKDAGVHERCGEVLRALKGRRTDAGSEGAHWRVWGGRVSLADLPLFGPVCREEMNGPQLILHGRRVDLSNPAARAILAGRAPPPGTPIPEDETFAIAETRSRWLNFNAFFALLWARGVWNGAFFALTTMRMQLEPFSLGSSPKLEEVSEPPELCLEVAALWLRVAGACIYACKEIMGPRGNPDWDTRRGCPGASGGTWDGVDGYDPARWAHWKGILKAAADANWGERVVEAVNSAIEAMETVERDAAAQ